MLELKKSDTPKQSTLLFHSQQQTVQNSLKATRFIFGVVSITSGTTGDKYINGIYKVNTLPPRRLYTL